MLAKLGVSSSSLNYNGIWWKSVRGSVFPKKIKIFLWKVFNQIIPTKHLLIVRNIRVDGRCVCYEKTFETEAHVLFFFVNELKRYERGCSCLNSFVSFKAPIRDALVQVANRLSMEFLIFGVLCWAIWNNRTLRNLKCGDLSFRS